MKFKNNKMLHSVALLLTLALCSLFRLIRSPIRCPSACLFIRLLRATPSSSSAATATVAHTEPQWRLAYHCNWIRSPSSVRLCAEAWRWRRHRRRRPHIAMLFHPTTATTRENQVKLLVDPRYRPIASPSFNITITSPSHYFYYCHHH